MNKRSKTPGSAGLTSRRTAHGFFVRLQREGKIYSAFFTDLKYGGRRRRWRRQSEFHRQSLAIFGPPPTPRRQWWAEIVRRKGRSAFNGVQKGVIRRDGKPRLYYWCATWSPEPYSARRKMFSIRKYGEEEARQQVIRARRAGLRSMVD